MRTVIRIACVGLLLGSLIVPFTRTRNVQAAPSRYFNDCGYQSEMLSLVGGTSKLFAALWKLPTAQFHQQQTQLLGHLTGINNRYGSVHHKEARAADAAIRAALASASSAVDGRDAGVIPVWTAKIKVAYEGLTTAGRALKTFCTLGHPARTQIDVSLTGAEYSDGISPMPIAPPWLAVPKSWTIHWTYVCRGVPNGLRIEVHAVKANLSTLFTEKSVYVGPVIAVPVSQNGGGGSGVAHLNGVSGPVYLVVRSRCQTSVKVVG